MNLWELSVDAVTAIVHLIQIHHLETWYGLICVCIVGFGGVSSLYTVKFSWLWTGPHIIQEMQMIQGTPEIAGLDDSATPETMQKKHEFHSAELCTEFVSYCRQCACKRNNLRVTLRDSWENMLETIASAVLFYFPQHAQCLSKSLKVHI